MQPLIKSTYTYGFGGLSGAGLVNAIANFGATLKKTEEETMEEELDIIELKIENLEALSIGQAVVFGSVALLELVLVLFIWLL